MIERKKNPCKSCGSTIYEADWDYESDSDTPNSIWICQCCSNETPRQIRRTTFTEQDLEDMMGG